MITRRQFGLASAAFTLSTRFGHAQSLQRTVRVGTLVNGGPGPIMEIFRSAFAKLGRARARL
jgi:hypothetical protein